MPQIVPFTFASQSGIVPASELDENFTAVQTSLTTELPITAATTTDLGSLLSNNVAINFSGSPVVTSFGSSAETTQPFFKVRWLGTGTASLTYNAISMVIVGGQSITINPNDQGIATYLGGGNWAYAPLTAPSIIVSSPSVQGTFKNLKSVWASTTTATITVDQVILQNSSNSAFLANAVNQTLNSALSGAGGLDTGSIATSTWYYIYIIYNGTTVSSLMSLSSSSPTLPSGYTYFALVSAVFTDGSSHFIGFVQYGRDYQWVVGNNLTTMRVAITGVSGNISTPVWTVVSLANFIPPTPICAKMKVSLAYPGSTGAAMAAPSNSYGASSSTTNPPPLLGGAGGSGVDTNTTAEFLVETSQTFYYASDVSGSTLSVVGFTLNL